MTSARGLDLFRARGASPFLMLAVLEFDETARRGTYTSDDVTFRSSSEARLEPVTTAGSATTTTSFPTPSTAAGAVNPSNLTCAIQYVSGWPLAELANQTIVVPVNAANPYCQ
jgi:hypothetical protein